MCNVVLYPIFVHSLHDDIGQVEPSLLPTKMSQISQEVLISKCYNTYALRTAFAFVILGPEQCGGCVAASTSCYQSTSDHEAC